MSRFESKNDKVQRIFRYLFSLVMAIFIYIAISFGTRERRRVSIPLNIIPNSQYTNNSNINDRIDIDILGDPSVIYNINPDKISAFLDCTFISKEGIYNIPVELNYSLGLLEGVSVEIVNTKPTIRASFAKR